MNIKKLSQKVADNSLHPQAFEITEALLTGEPLPEIKKPVRKYRVYEYKSMFGGYATTTIDNDDEVDEVENVHDFVRWLTDWIIIDEPQSEQWPSKLVARIAKIDLAAATWLRDNWEELKKPEYQRHISVGVESNKLLSMFDWKESPQGHDYWRKISKKLGEDKS